MTQTTTEPTTAPLDAVAADRALKAKHRAMWALGDYPAVAREVIAELGPTLVEAVGVRAGDRVIDVAAGSGNVAIPAALAGATVVATDLTPELLTAGEQQAPTAEIAAAGGSLRWRVADAEAMPCDDGEHDVVLSCVGVMFAPHHQVAADELIRILRPGGRLGLISWTPQGFIGQLFAALKPFNPPPPPGVQPPPLWGDEDHVRALLGDRVDDLQLERRTLRVTRFAAPADFWDFFRSAYGPTVATYRTNAADPERVAALDAALVAVAERFHDGTGMDWEYLLVTGRRA